MDNPETHIVIAKTPYFPPVIIKKIVGSIDDNATTVNTIIDKYGSGNIAISRTDNIEILEAAKVTMRDKRKYDEISGKNYMIKMIEPNIYINCDFDDCWFESYRSDDMQLDHIFINCTFTGAARGYNTAQLYQYVIPLDILYAQNRF